MRDTPAAEAGLEPRDVAIRFNGELITTSDEFIHLIRTSPLGDELDITIIRGGEEMTLSVVLAVKQ